ncbi:hypothetical protein KEM55_007258 [Ascosphaera atra]|nr:hypothetical protein KEM55_007258 [Ascosphaera atra]
MSPAKRQENVRAQSPGESLRRLKSVSPARPHTQHIYNYAAQLIKDSPPPPPLPPSPSTIASPGKGLQSPLQRKGGQVNANSQAGAGPAEGQQGSKNGYDGVADEDRESTDPANIPLPRGSSSISPSPVPEMFRGKGIASLSMANRMRSSHSPIFAREASWSCSPPPAESIQERLMRGNFDPHGVKERSPLNNSVEIEQPPREEANPDPGLPNCK